MAQGKPRKSDGGGAPGFIRLKLVPSDQLLSIAVVNAIIFTAAWITLQNGYDGEPPKLPTWVILVALGTIVFPGLLATSDSWLPKLWNIIVGDSENGSSPTISENVMKPAVFIFSGLTLLVLWQLTDRTDGVAGPFVPFLTAPAVFSPFVARNPLPIGLLSVAVLMCIAFLQTPTPQRLLTPEQWTFKLAAGIMIAIAAALTIVRLVIEKRGGPITGPGSPPATEST